MSRNPMAEDETSADQVEDSGPILRRRSLLKTLAAAGVGTETFRRALVARADDEGKITPEMIAQAEWIAGLDLTDEERQKAADLVGERLQSFDRLRKVDVGYDVPPALWFRPLESGPETTSIRRNQAVPREWHPPALTGSDEQLAFLPVTELSALIRERRVTSTELTRLYLGRLKRFDSLLKCVVTLTEDLALEQAEKADRELKAGVYRGPLHGIPWGAKDLIAFPGYPTTWGATPFRDRVIDVKATVAERLEEAGAVMLGKLSLGALAMGDQWFGGMTRSPWDPRRGSSGSSAGSASAVAAGLVGFAIGSETLGSIISPCRACGASGLRPTFGRVSRYGCMALSWSMDKIGPIARSLEDCALILDAIHGSDPLDPSAVDRPFVWPPMRDSRTLKVGYIEHRDQPAEEREDLRVLRSFGIDPVPIKLPEEYPIHDITLMLGTEAAAVFDPLTRQHITKGLNEWPDTFLQGEFVPAVEYLRAARVRTLLMQAMEEVMKTVDVYVAGGADLPITNLTGHPSAVCPFQFRERHGREVPGSVVFTGRLYDESTLLALAIAFQTATGDHLRRPPIEEYLREGPTEPKTESENADNDP